MTGMAEPGVAETNMKGRESFQTLYSCMRSLVGEQMWIPTFY
jgi:hypothetical protein